VCGLTLALRRALLSGLAERSISVDVVAAAHQHGIARENRSERTVRGGWTIAAR